MRIYRYEVPVDGSRHDLELTGPILHVSCRNGDPRIVHIWALEGVSQPSSRRLRVFGTGHEIPEDYSYVGTAVCEPLVWHLLEQVS